MTCHIAKNNHLRGILYLKSLIAIGCVCFVALNNIGNGIRKICRFGSLEETEAISVAIKKIEYLQKFLNKQLEVVERLAEKFEEIIPQINMIVKNIKH